MFYFTLICKHLLSFYFRFTFTLISLRYHKTLVILFNKYFSLKDIGSIKESIKENLVRSFF